MHIKSRESEGSLAEQLTTRFQTGFPFQKRDFYTKHSGIPHGNLDKPLKDTNLGMAGPFYLTPMLDEHD